MKHFLINVSCRLAIGMLALCFTSSGQAEECGHADDVFLSIETDWHTGKGSAQISGKNAAPWLEASSQARDLSCLRQGGSSMAPWWSCSKTLADGKKIEITFGYRRDRPEAYAWARFFDDAGEAYKTYLTCHTGR